jgi:release factor glutamine methyltransferase
MKSNIIEFEKFKLKTANDVFFPRDDIEIFPRALKNIIKIDSKILELGTGTGAISIAMAKNFNNIKIVATDINSSALRIAKENAILNKVDKVITFKQSNWFSKIEENKFDFIVSNPPYLSKKNSSYYTELTDPENSLYAKNDGLDDIYKIFQLGVNYLNRDSYIVIEHSHNQTLTLKDCSKKYNLKLLKSEKDILGFNRVSIFSNRV